MAQIVWSFRSLKDIDEIANYIAKASFLYAEEQVRQFFLRAKVFGKMPLIGRMIPELKANAIRQILCDITGSSLKYLICGSLALLQFIINQGYWKKIQQ
jgi:plasmid stabilization system protein ParE